jgi:hypothetical protein
MSVKMMAAVWELDLPRTRKLVLLAVADHASDDGFAYPSVARLAWKCGYSERSIQRELRELEKAELLFVVREGGGRGKATTYCVQPEKGDKLAPFQPKSSRPKTVTSEDETVTSEDETVTPTTGNGDKAMAPQPSVTVGEPSEPSAAPSRCHVDECPLRSPCWAHEERAGWDLRDELVARRWVDPKGRKRDLIWEALALVTGIRDLDACPRSELGRVNAAAKELRDLGGVMPSDVIGRAAEYKDRWPTMELTPQALTANWHRLSRPRPGSVRAALDALRAAREAAEAREALDAPT